MIGTVLLFWIMFLFIHHRYYWESKLPKGAKIPGNILISHRGLKFDAPENTIKAYLNATKNNFTWIEIDVLSTKDGVLVCSHNYDLERETEGRGDINKLSYDELDRRLIKDKHDNNLYHDIPTLSEVLRIIPDNIGLNIEIKTSSVFDLSASRALIKQYKLLSKRPYIITTFNPVVVIYFKMFFRKVPIGIILESYKYFWLTNWIHPHMLIPRADMLSNELFFYCKNKKLPILTWTVNNSNAISWCQNKQIIGIMTDLGK